MERLLYESKYDISGDSIEPVYEGDNVITAVFAPDNNFCKYFGVALQSLIENADRNLLYDIVVFENDITSVNKERLIQMLPQNFSLRFFDINSSLKRKFKNLKFPPILNWSISMYYRIFIPLLMNNYKRVLYIDSDVCIINDLKELFNIDFCGKQVAVTYDSVTRILKTEKNRKHEKFMKSTLKLEEPEQYFNSGIMLFNNDNINIEDYTKKIISALHISGLKYPDQDILNVIFAKNKLMIDKTWNYENGMMACCPIYYLKQLNQKDYSDFAYTKDNFKIIHYTTEVKPWIYPKIDKADIFWKYARKSPFYEEIIYENTLFKSSILARKKHIISKYYFYKFLSSITFGKLREKYTSKRYKWKKLVNKYRQIKKLKI